MEAKIVDIDTYARETANMKNVFIESAFIR